MRQNHWLYLFVLLIFSACKSTEKASSTAGRTVELDTIEVSSGSKPPPYQPSQTRTVDLLHTKLEVSFDWEKQHLLGEAELWLTPYFYTIDSVVLDAKSMDIHQVHLVKPDTNLPLVYKYKNNLLNVTLPNNYNRNDSIQLFIDYTAMPNQAKADESGSAILSDKGLYFIDPLGEDKSKPTQVWTQGEPEANSHWFPTIDAPNERCTQEIAITVDKRYTTLSNGTLEFSTLNENNTRTDYWAQEKPHAPYLFMMAVGEYAVVEDSWRNKSVHYYVEPEYEEHAEQIFKHTPEMIELFSTRFGVPYPWHKYHQVVVRDYVSGAMENTSAVIYGEFVQKTGRELIDGDNQDIVAHELSHHWFGDLVTCESWSNLPLNESFATYAPYIWKEYKHSKDAADHYLYNNLQSYFEESLYKKVDMVRYHYHSPDDMFDSHSYAKGANILHMLREVVGDDAFFSSLKHYLEENAYQSVEIHDLRLAFEEVTGRDLKWFFDQWFLDNGHPQLEVDYFFIPDSSSLSLTITQEQDPAEFPQYRIPLTVNIWHGDDFKSHEIELTEQKQTFALPCNKLPGNVMVDPEGTVPAKWIDNKRYSWYVHQFHHERGYKARRKALEVVAESAHRDTSSKDLVLAALDDGYWHIRLTGLNYIQDVLPYNEEEIFNRCKTLAVEDSSPQVRKAALSTLIDHYQDRGLTGLLQQKLSDSSYAVLGKALYGVYSINPEMGLMLAEEFEGEESNVMMMQLADVYAKSGKRGKLGFFKKKADVFNGIEKGQFISSWGEFLVNANSNTATLQSVPKFEQMALGEPSWWVRFFIVQTLSDLRLYYNQLGSGETEETNSTYTQIEQEISKSLNRILKEETNPRILNYFGRPMPAK